MSLTPDMIRRMRLCEDSQYMLELWLKTRGDMIMPRVKAALFISDQRLGDRLILEFLAPDRTVRFAFAGVEIAHSFGFNLAGMEISDLFNESDKKQVNDMARAKFMDPVVIHSVSSHTTLTGEVMQVERLQVPFINKKTSELIYALGSFETSDPVENRAVDGMATEMVLFRNIYDLKTLKPVTHDHTFPPPVSPDVAEAAKAEARHA